MGGKREGEAQGPRVSPEGARRIYKDKGLWRQTPGFELVLDPKLAVVRSVTFGIESFGLLKGDNNPRTLQHYEN